MHSLLKSTSARSVKLLFFQLRRLSYVRKHFDFNSFEVLIHAFVTSRLDYCNSLLSGAPLSDIHQLQMVQNYAARLLTFHRKRDHITPFLQEWHWLPVASRINFKVLLLMYKSLNSLAPAYLTDKIKRLQPLRSLRSCDGYKAIVPLVHKVRLGDRAFSIIGPKLWNSLPIVIRSAPSIRNFKSLLKTHFSRLAYH